MRREDLMNFNRIDETENPGEFIAFLDAVSRNEGIMAMKSRTYELLDARAGQRILEVGCGTGDDARQIAKMISPGGSLVAIDKSEALISEARRRSGRRSQVRTLLALPARSASLPIWSPAQPEQLPYWRPPTHPEPGRYPRLRDNPPDRGALSSVSGSSHY